MLSHRCIVMHLSSTWRQRGQAMLEAVIVFFLLSVTLLCVLGAARMQLDWHGDLLVAHSAAQALAAGHDSKVLRQSGSRVFVEKARLAGSGPDTASIDSVLDGPMDWVGVQTQGVYANQAWQLRGQGAVSSVFETVERIAHSAPLWAQTSRQSQRVVKRLAPMTEKVDLPWGRAKVSTDWLSSWRDLSEYDRVDQGFINSDLMDEVVQMGRKVLGGLF